MWVIHSSFSIASTISFHFCLILLVHWQIAGVHLDNCRLLKTDSSKNYALSPDILCDAISQDMSNGLIPFFLCATVRRTLSHPPHTHKKKKRKKKKKKKRSVFYPNFHQCFFQNTTCYDCCYVCFSFSFTTYQWGKVI